MHRCPKCGYREKYDWPATLLVIAFFALYIVFVGLEVEEHVSRSYRLMGLGAFLLFLAANMWNMLRNVRSSRDYQKLHPLAVTERVKDHIRTNPSQ